MRIQFSNEPPKVFLAKWGPPKVFGVEVDKREHLSNTDAVAWFDRIWAQSLEDAVRRASPCDLSFVREKVPFRSQGFIKDSAKHREFTLSNCQFIVQMTDWLSAFIGGGSDLDVPIQELPRMYKEIGAPAGVTDLVMITDAKCRIPPEVKKRFLDWRLSARVRAVALVVGNQPGDLAGVCDEVHQVAALDPAGDAVGRVLSL